MNVTTNHSQIGYNENVNIIIETLRSRFGFTDDSSVLVAVAQHIWSMICPGSENTMWGDPEIVVAIQSCKDRLDKMTASMLCHKPGCAVSYPHYRHQHEAGKIVMAPTYKFEA